MTQETTIAKDAPDSKPESALAPMAGQPQTAQTVPPLGQIAPIPENAAPQDLVQLEPIKRKKTGGERLFDLTTYGGFALVGNEITATHIVGQAGKSNMIGRAISSGGEFFKKIGTPGKLPYIQERMNYISFAIIGGFVMVPFIKWFEDNKGRCVRFADRIFYGERAHDPEIAKRHEEMDEAPQQSWGSLGKGRIFTVAAAYAVDSTINWEHGLLARALKGTRFENHASLEHLSNHTAEWMNNKIAPMRNLSPEKALQQKGFIKNLVGLTTLSATLTLIFYASSKLFARKRDEKLEQRYAQLHDQKDGLNTDEAELASTLIEVADKAQPAASAEAIAAQAITKASESAKKAGEAPHPHVNHVAHEQTVATAPELAAAAG